MRRERPEQARVLLVAGQHLVAGAELERGERGVHPVGRGVGEGELVDVAAEQARQLPAQLLAEPEQALEVRHPAAALGRLPLDLTGRRGRRPGGHRSLGPGVQVGEAFEYGELGAQLTGVHGPILSWSRP
jgi:hypothetical protein